MNIRLPQDKIDFIFANYGKIKQVDIAQRVGISPAYVNKILRWKPEEPKEEGVFEHLDYYKNYNN